MRYETAVLQKELIECLLALQQESFLSGQAGALLNARIEQFANQGQKTLFQAGCEALENVFATKFSTQNNRAHDRSSRVLG